MRELNIWATLLFGVNDLAKTQSFKSSVFTCIAKVGLLVVGLILRTTDKVLPNGLTYDSKRGTVD